MVWRGVPRVFCILKHHPPHHTTAPRLTAQHNAHTHTQMLLLLLSLFPVAHASVPAYHDWLLGNGVELHEAVDLHSYEEPRKAPSVKSSVKNGTVLASVSTEIILNMKSISAHPPLDEVLNSKQFDGQLTNVVKLAVFLQHGKHWADSPWKLMIESFPNYGSSTAFWPEKDLMLLNGTTVYKRTLDRMRGISSIHTMLSPSLTTTDVPGLFSTEEAFSITGLLYYVQYIFSHSDTVSGANSEPTPVLIPFIESLPRSPTSCCSLEARNSESGATSELVLVAKRDMEAGEELGVFTQRTEHYQSLLDRGTLDLQNENNGIPFAFRSDNSDVQRAMKNQIFSLMQTSEMSEHVVLNTDDGSPPPLLLRKLRVQMLDFQNFDSYRKIINSDKPISLGNELRVLRTLWSATTTMLRGFSNHTIEYEVDFLNTFRTDDNTPKPMTRPEVSGHIRLLEKTILMKLRIWIQKKWLSLVEVPFEDLVQLQEFRALQTL